MPTLLHREPVESSNIDSIGYDEATQTLQVAFKARDGIRVYGYEGVPREAHDALMASASKGQYFAAHIKGQYPSMRLE